MIIVDDTSSWPVIRVGERHVFQPGAQGGSRPQDYLGRPHTPSTDESARGRVGRGARLAAAVADWGRAHGRPWSR